MLFHEIYGAYYHAMAILINKAIDLELDLQNATKLIKTEAFRESFVYILDAIQNEQWQLITKDYKTPIKHYVNSSITTLQKQFLKAISLDKRFALFIEDKIKGLDDVKPLYEEEDFYYFDMIRDGDPYESPEYIKIFKTVFRGLKEKRQLSITYVDGKENAQRKVCTPRRLEYSEKDDKFRLLSLGIHGFSTINLARITSCELHDAYSENAVKPFLRNKSSIILELIDERNALERCMLHFSNYEKVTTQVDEKYYEIKLKYYSDDETEVLIRVLSFGPLVKVKSPDSFIDQVKERLRRQRKF